MNILPAHLAALCRFGYSDQEATSIYLVATHSGYFTRPQFLRFTRLTMGGIFHRFTTKLLALGHVRATESGRQVLVFHLFSDLVHGAIEKDNLGNRRRLSNELVRACLFILDLVLANLDSQYLETEAAVDRFPILNSRSLPSVPTFVYCDSDKPGLRSYFTHLRAYERLWRRLERFHFIYAAPSPTKFRRAEARFHRCSLRRQRSVRSDWPGILRFGSCGNPTKPACSPAPTAISCAMATRDIRENPFSLPTRNGHRRPVRNGVGTSPTPPPARASDGIRDPHSAGKLRHFSARD